MFNDLTGNQDQQSSKVDDIFAETDKTPTTADHIQTRQVGLSALSDAPSVSDNQTSAMPEVETEHASSGKFLKIAIIAVVVAILILGGYLIYTNFFSGAKVVVEEPQVVVVDNNENQAPVDNTQVNQNNNQGDFVVPLVEQEELPLENETVVGNEVVVDTPATIDSDGDGLSDYDEVNLHMTNPNLIDTDFDGLSDYDELKTHKTDALKSDTDSDGLSDYEEINVYGTDPLNKDSDGDTYLDGDEVKSGYNPLDGNGGRLPGF